MTQSQLQKLLVYLSKQNTIFGPKKVADRLLVGEIKEPGKFKLTNEKPFYSHKQFLLPSPQTLFHYDQNKLNKPKAKRKQVLIGIPVYDLKAFTLLHEVFEKDAYFQEIIRRTILIGHSPLSEDGSFYEEYEEDVLEHIRFDIFLEFKPKGEFKVFTGSEDGQRILERVGIKNYDHVEYAGAVPEEGLPPREKEDRQLIKNSRNNNIWKELNKQCIACGKCSLVCPTCFCFNIDDQAGFGKKQGQRIRKWSVCFYDQFSEIAGGEKFLKTIGDRIYNWYEHKFVRIPDEYNLPGCVACGRCIEICPANIDLRKTFKQLTTNNRQQTTDDKRQKS